MTRQRLTGMMTVALLVTSLFVIGCGNDSPNGPITAGDGDGNVQVDHAGGTGTNTNDKDMKH